MAAAKVRLEEATPARSRSRRGRLPTMVTPVAVALIALGLWFADVVWAKPVATTHSAHSDKPAVSQRVAREAKQADLELVVSRQLSDSPELR